MAIGLIGVGFTLPAQAQTQSKKVVKHAVVKKHVASQKKHSKTSKKTTVAAHHTGKSKHASVKGSKSHKKTLHAKNTAKNRRHHALASRTRTHKTPSSYELPATQPSDLWLAKDSPEAYRQLNFDAKTDELTRSILESAYAYIGVPYRYGGTTPDGFDCSGFVRQVFSENGIQLGRSSRDQALEGTPVPLSELKPGDLLFFSMHRRNRCSIDHVGLYVGQGQFIHAPSSRAREIKVETLESDRYLPKVVEARRVLEYTR
ncbi:MAG: NlpC/P60 family protein [Deltaproteobacteria bacterium]|nr:NlpC/P60 family protein [Deltaproteobacteria bacterium]